jgi:uncharacterized protein
MKYELKLSGLKEGDYRYSYRLEEDFFQRFESEILQKGEVDVLLQAVKSTDKIELELKYSGWVLRNCDLCLEQVKVSLDSTYSMLVKLTYDELEPEHDVLYVSPNAQSLPLEQVLWDFAVLSIPMKITCELDLNGKACGGVGYSNEETEKETHPEFEKLKKLLNKD